MTNDNLCFYLQNILIQTSQTGGQQYSDPSPFSIPGPNHPKQGRQTKDAYFKDTQHKYWKSEALTTHLFNKQISVLTMPPTYYP
jgi:hypothetical protein